MPPINMFTIIWQAYSIYCKTSIAHFKQWHCPNLLNPVGNWNLEFIYIKSNPLNDFMDISIFLSENTLCTCKSSCKSSFFIKLTSCYCLWPPKYKNIQYTTIYENKFWTQVNYLLIGGARLDP